MRRKNELIRTSESEMSGFRGATIFHPPVIPPTLAQRVRSWLRTLLFWVLLLTIVYFSYNMGLASAALDAMSGTGLTGLVDDAQAAGEGGETEAWGAADTGGW